MSDIEESVKKPIENKEEYDEAVKHAKEVYRHLKKSLKMRSKAQLIQIIATYASDLQEITTYAKELKAELDYMKQVHKSAMEQSSGKSASKEAKELIND